MQEKIDTNPTVQDQMYKMLNTNVCATYWDSDCFNEHDVLGGVTQVPIRYKF